ncbi:hypothetical protein RJ640_026933 [Escallonia rubra]|uniref:Metallothionein n=1 Tax=Escallonia rubra TaxID=112253 RepID=A0AA88RRZ9_9ASTE|nr:hypothetical protein RJ640_026933 [Escallonia rubra]
MNTGQGTQDSVVAYDETRNIIIMADRVSAVVCNDRCGCPSPCPGGLACRCRSGGEEDPNMQHKECSCGEHCGCNPCTCPKTVTGTGRASCKCGAGCTCVTCAASS